MSDDGFVLDFVSGLTAEAKRIEQEKDGKALTEHEAQVLRAEDFLRKIAPYWYEPPA